MEFLVSVAKIWGCHYQKYIKIMIIIDMFLSIQTHVSFSLSDTGGEDSDLSKVPQKASVQQNAVRLILQSVGVTLTNVDDVVFK